MVEHDLAKVGVEGPSPFSRSKKEKPPTKVGFFFYIVIWTRPREEGATKQRDARSANELFRNYRVAISQALRAGARSPLEGVMEDPAISLKIGDPGINPG